MFDDTRASWQNPRILSTLLLVFLCGAAVGVLAMRSGAHDTLRRSADPEEARESGRDAMLERFKKELNLRPDQTEQMELVLDDFWKYYQTLQAQMDEVRATGKDRILRILDADQRKRFERMVSDLQTRQIR
ncbi:MAG: hypothetical protein OZ929_22575 [Bryobacterales bacterium]|nr:hypothetical protein [Bryobacterales bacterium]